MKISKPRPSYESILADVLAISQEQFGGRRPLRDSDRPVRDLGVDSLDLIEWVMEIEERFELSLPAPEQLPDQVYKQLFSSPNFTIADMARLVVLRWGSGAPAREQGSSGTPTPSAGRFDQLGGRLEARPDRLHTPLGRNDAGFLRFRRNTDGMCCVAVPGGEVELGCEHPQAGADERPLRRARLDSYLIDEEIVSATAFCRFLNSIPEPDEATLRAWFLLLPDERRQEHQIIENGPAGWVSKDGCAEWPMMLVSWHGAHAYALWVNGGDWSAWKSDKRCFLPSEAQWEVAARGPSSRLWPWGDRHPAPGEINAGRHGFHRRYGSVGELPLWPVHDDSATSPYGVRQMAGNVWQWCRDWYDPESPTRNGEDEPLERRVSGVRSERGGSWVGGLSLARSSYRRGRAPEARGRCLGIRCVGVVPGV